MLEFWKVNSIIIRISSVFSRPCHGNFANVCIEYNKLIKYASRTRDLFCVLLLILWLKRFHTFLLLKGETLDANDVNLVLYCIYICVERSKKSIYSISNFHCAFCFDNQIRGKLFENEIDFVFESFDGSAPADRGQTKTAPIS